MIDLSPVASSARKTTRSCRCGRPEWRSKTPVYGRARPVLEGSVLEGPVLEGSVLEGSVLEGSVLEGPVLEGSVLDASVTVVTLLPSVVDSVAPDTPRERCVGVHKVAGRG
jgi:hypothetical protein